MYILCTIAVGAIGVLVGMIIEAMIENMPTVEQPVEDDITIIELSEDYIEQPGEAVIDADDDYFEPF